MGRDQYFLSDDHVADTVLDLNPLSKSWPFGGRKGVGRKKACQEFCLDEGRLIQSYT